MESSVGKGATCVANPRGWKRRITQKGPKGVERGGREEDIEAKGEKEGEGRREVSEVKGQPDWGSHLAEEGEALLYLLQPCGCHFSL